jgi:RNA polymerase sigma factor (sigma-70 family)
LRAGELVQLFQGYAQALQRFLARRVGCQEAAAELMQETYLRLASLDGGHRIDNPGAYLFQIAEHLAVDHLHQHTRVQRHYAGTPAEDLPSQAPSPEAEVVAREQCHLLRQAIRELPPKCRTVFLLHRVQHLSYEEIARQLGISRKTVEKHVSKALTHCRKRLEQGAQAFGRE